MESDERAVSIGQFERAGQGVADCRQGERGGQTGICRTRNVLNGSKTISLDGKT
jgi:hypothetical protein